MPTRAVPPVAQSAAASTMAPPEECMHLPLASVVVEFVPPLAMGKVPAVRGAGEREPQNEPHHGLPPLGHRASSSGSSIKAPPTRIRAVLGKIPGIVALTFFRLRRAGVAHAGHRQVGIDAGLSGASTCSTS